MSRVAVAATLLGAALAGCAAGNQTVDFTVAPSVLPVDRGEYETIRRRWTRHAHIRNDYDAAFDADLTLLSPEFRAAWASRVGDMRRLSTAERAELADEQRRQAGEGVEFAVMLQASRWEWNDLSSPHTLWTITFADDEGRVVSSADVLPLADKPETLGALFPERTPFTRGWRVRFPIAFPDGTPLLRRGAKYVSVRIAGPLGEDEVRWLGRPTP